MALELTDVQQALLGLTAEEKITYDPAARRWLIRDLPADDAERAVLSWLYSAGLIRRLPRRHGTGLVSLTAASEKQVAS